MNTGFLRPAVATVLTVYGIETSQLLNLVISLLSKLQQYLPFTVLKLVCRSVYAELFCWLQQYLPLTVLKLTSSHDKIPPCGSCNSTYRLRY